MRSGRGARHGANLRRALDAAKTASGIDGGEKRLSWHARRHSAGSIWLTEHGQPITTVSAMMGHSKSRLHARLLRPRSQRRAGHRGGRSGTGGQSCERRLRRATRRLVEGCRERGLRQNLRCLLGCEFARAPAFPALAHHAIPQAGGGDVARSLALRARSFREVVLPSPRAIHRVVASCPRSLP